jgi:site-specific recombinase XerD
MTTAIPFNNLLKEYINSFDSPNSRLAYIRDLKQFQVWCADVGVNDLLAVGAEVASSYRDFLVDQFSLKTMERKLSAVKGLYRLAFQKKVIPKNPFYEIRPPEKNQADKKKILKPLDHSEVERILLFPNLKSEEGCRDYVMLFLMFSLGLKIGEVVNIHVKDFKKYENGFLVHLRKTKGTGYYSKVPSNCLTLINRYINDWHIKGFLFTSIAKNSQSEQEKRTPLTPRSGWYILKIYLKKGRLERKGRTTNCAREFFIQSLLAMGLSPENLRKILGLQSMNAMRRYGIEDLTIAKEQLTFKDHPVDKIKLEVRDY